MASECMVTGRNAAALFTLKLHRGDGMLLIAMDWKEGTPSDDFVGFALEYMEPGGTRFYSIKNRLNFLDAAGRVNPKILPTRLSPIQKFRWVHFPRNADMSGEFVYRVSPVFMNEQDELSYGEPQEAAIELSRETYKGQLNVTFTRGYVSSQAFVDKYTTPTDGLETLIPAVAEDGLGFKPAHPRAGEALPWMGFEARSAILEVLDEALADGEAEVCMVAYDLNLPEMVSRLKKLGKRLRIIIDDSDTHGEPGSAENRAAGELAKSAGNGRVKRQHLGNLQHNKTIVVQGPKVQAVVCGSTNFSWRGFYVQSNNAVILRGKEAAAPFQDAFENYWKAGGAKHFGSTASAGWSPLGLKGIDAAVSFSPHSKSNALLGKIAEDIEQHTVSNLFYSLAFLYQTKGAIRDAVQAVSNNAEIFVYGISDKKLGGLSLQKPDGNVMPVYAAALGKDLPEPFKRESSGGRGTQMHHKFIVVDFDKPSARVYLGSYNFSNSADMKNGENLLLIRDRRIAVSYAIEAIRIFDHYHFRVAQKEAKGAKRKLALRRPPRQPGETPWWSEYYTDPHKIRDRELFA